MFPQDKSNDIFCKGFKRKLPKRFYLSNLKKIPLGFRIFPPGHFSTRVRKKAAVSKFKSRAEKSSAFSFVRLSQILLFGKE